jgi:serine/threonine protein kinase
LTKRTHEEFRSKIPILIRKPKPNATAPSTETDVPLTRAQAAYNRATARNTVRPVVAAAPARPQPVKVANTRAPTAQPPKVVKPRLERIVKKVIPKAQRPEPVKTVNPKVQNVQPAKTVNPKVQNVQPAKTVNPKVPAVHPAKKQAEKKENVGPRMNKVHELRKENALKTVAGFAMKAPLLKANPAKKTIVQKEVPKKANVVKKEGAKNKLFANAPVKQVVNQVAKGLPANKVIPKAPMKGLVSEGTEVNATKVEKAPANASNTSTPAVSMNVTSSVNETISSVPKCVLANYIFSIPFTPSSLKRVVVAAKDHERKNVKVIFFKRKEDFIREADILITLNKNTASGGPKVALKVECVLEEFEVTKTDLYSVIVTEEVTGKDMEYAVDRFSARELTQWYPWIVESLLKNMGAMHKHGILYDNWQLSDLLLTLSENYDRIVLFTNLREARRVNFKQDKAIFKDNILKLAQVLEDLYRPFQIEYPFLHRFGLFELVGEMRRVPESFNISKALSFYPLFNKYKNVLEFLEPHMPGVKKCDWNGYMLINKIGSGTDGTTFLIAKDGEEFIMKVENIGQTPLLEEIQILGQIAQSDFEYAPTVICASLRGPFSLFDTRGQSVHFQSAAFIMRRAPGEILTHFWKKYVSSTTQSAQIIDANFRRHAVTMVAMLQELNSEGFYHLDSHAGNWLFDISSNSMFLIDFGRARAAAGPHFDACGWAPEIDPTQPGMQGYGRCSKYGTFTDVFVLGQALNYLYTDIIEASRGRITKVPSDVKDILDKMVKKDPRSRPTFDQVLQHRAFRNIDSAPHPDCLDMTSAHRYERNGQRVNLLAALRRGNGVDLDRLDAFY